MRRDLDLYVVWKFSPKTQLPLVACNLLGKDYINDSSYTVAGSGTQRSRIIYPSWRMLRATMEVKF